MPDANMNLGMGDKKDKKEKKTKKEKKQERREKRLHKVREEQEKAKKDVDVHATRGDGGCVLGTVRQTNKPATRKESASRQTRRQSSAGRTAAAPAATASGPTIETTLSSLS